MTHTNALFLGDKAFDFKDGLFSGYDEEKHKYDTTTWGYQLDGKGKPKVAASLDDPHCVFARLKNFVSRYTLEMGERISGIPAAQIEEIAETFAKNRPGHDPLRARDDPAHDRRPGHPRFTILQLLLGNIGKPGGGVNALRGEPNVQGACDMAVLNNYMPGYLNYPTPRTPRSSTGRRTTGSRTASTWSTRSRRSGGTRRRRRTTSPTTGSRSGAPAKDYGTLSIFEDALAGKMKVLWIVGQNPRSRCRT